MLSTAAPSDPLITLWVFFGTLGGVLFSAVIRKFVSVMVDRSERRRNKSEDNFNTTKKQLNLANSAIDEIQKAVISAQKGIAKQIRQASGQSPIVLYSPSTPNIQYENFDTTLIRIQHVCDSFSPSLVSVADFLRTTGFHTTTAGSLSECATQLHTLKSLASKIIERDLEENRSKLEGNFRISKHLQDMRLLEKYSGTLKGLDKQLIMAKQYTDKAIKYTPKKINT